MLAGETMRVLGIGGTGIQVLMDVVFDVMNLIAADVGECQHPPGISLAGEIHAVAVTGRISLIGSLRERSCELSWIQGIAINILDDNLGQRMTIIGIMRGLMVSVENRSQDQPRCNDI